MPRTANTSWSPATSALDDFSGPAFGSPLEHPLNAAHNRANTAHTIDRFLMVQFPQSEGKNMSTLGLIILIVVLVMLFGGGGGNN